MDTRERLLQSAKELFSKRGYHETTVDEIVNRAGLSKGAFYFYFTSKEQILKELVKIMSDNMIENLRRNVQMEGDVEVILKRCVSDFFQMFYQDREIAYIFFFELLRVSEDFKKLHMERTQIVRDLLSQLVSRGIVKGEIKHKNVDVIVSLLMGFVRFLYLEKVFTDGLTLEEVTNLALEGIGIVMRGVKCGY